MPQGTRHTRHRKPWTSRSPRLEIRASLLRVVHPKSLSFSTRLQTDEAGYREQGGLTSHHQTIDGGCSGRVGSRLQAFDATAPSSSHFHLTNESPAPTPHERPPIGCRPWRVQRAVEPLDRVDSPAIRSTGTDGVGRREIMGLVLPFLLMYNQAGPRASWA